LSQCLETGDDDINSHASLVKHCVTNGLVIAQLKSTYRDGVLRRSYSG
jgi:hypothetical protein